MATMPRERMNTPLEEIRVTADTGDPAYWMGVAARVDAMLGEYPRAPRAPGTHGPHDPGDPGSEGRGLARRVYRIDQTLGRMPGTNGVDDEGDGVAAHVFHQRRETRRGSQKSTGALIAAATAVLMALATLLRAEARSLEPRQGSPAAQSSGR